MIVQFTADCGHHPAGEILECEHANGSQYIASGFAEVYVEPKPEPAKSELVTVAEPKSPLSKKMLDALVAGGYEELDDIMSASDDELLAVKGIGKAAVALIRGL